MNKRTALRAGTLVASIGLVVSTAAAPALAGGNGAETQTEHAHGADAAGLVVIDFLPQDGPALPDGCWLPDTDALVSTVGNAIEHSIGNRTGGWFTSTYAGGAEVLPILFNSGAPEVDQNGNDVVDTSAAPLATGHLNTWFGAEGNQKNEVDHATMTFQGTQANGAPANISAHFQFGTNANGDPTATVADVTC